MKYIFVDESWEDYLYWQKSDMKILSNFSFTVNAQIISAYD
ncbi:MAG: type II toxin-antitoxin system YoeB family toxin [Bacteroidetes bacterium]|nr:type II toxin-antitoxin system YoeB family toxin [Bacteroidota bacterium]